jgi:tripartite-type tricarboxylate transporter receptor subunit TctC
MRFLSGIALALCAASVCAQDYPTKPVRIVVPYAPGGVTDVVTRMLQPKMTELLGQPIIVENVAAAGGVVGSNQVARAAPDGYQLISVFDGFATNPYLYKNVQHDPVKDFAPISLVVRSPQIFVVHPSLNVQSIQAFVQLAKAKGDALAFATAGAGTSSRFSVELFKGAAGIEPTLVSYKGGGPALNDLLGGQVAAMIASMSLVLPHVQRGRLVPLAVSSAKRLPQLPNVPTIAETYPGFEVQSWVGFLAPAGTPRSIIDRLNGATSRALTAPEVREKLEGLGVEIVASTPEALGEWVRSESAKWERVIRERKITLE